MTAPSKVLDLIEVFQRNAEEYLSTRFNEAMLRQQFVNPLFKCLGWDMDNEQGYAEAYKDVIHEASLKIGVETKAPDYCFRIGGTAKFYLEAKKPAVGIKEDPAPAFQLRRYAWSAKLPLSILTNFAEFAVYDCRVKPVQTDKASAARILYLGYDEYEKQWDNIAGVFSREAVLKGSFDKYAESKKGKKGTATVDAAFLAEIESWREELAKNLALRNPRLESRELNFAVQMTIDRIIFLRMCEDRGIEPYAQFRDLQFRLGIYSDLLDIYRRADERYNSGLFHFTKEQGRPEEPDELTPHLKIDDKVLKAIFKNLYYPDSPYEFSVLPVEILGQVYEQFLGKVIRLTAGHQAKVEEKPEVKKAGGVYYTPSYIVDYIVKHTVGKLLEEKSPKQAAKLRILDPACGSGSFLLGAYKYLLDWHLKRYEEEGPEKHKKEVFQAGGGVWRLTTSEKKRILLNNIYGVDIDPQAVEVTKLSLLLKVLEGESQETLATQLHLYHERALPDLASNIKCGNSLIGTNFYEARQGTLFDEEVKYRVNAFDWEKGYPQIMKVGGFDAVIGNPPYVRIQTLQEWMPESAEYMSRHYAAAKTGNYDIYVVFIDRGLSLLNLQGRLAFIMPQKFWQVRYGEALRSKLAEGQHLERVVSFRNNQVFDTAFINTCIMVLSKTAKSDFDYVEIPKLESSATIAESLRQAQEWALSASVIGGPPWVLKSSRIVQLLEKLAAAGDSLEKCTRRIFQGLKTSADKVYVVEILDKNESRLRAYSNELDREVDFEPGLFHLLIKGTEMRRYVSLPLKRMILFPYETTGNAVRLIEQKKLKKEFPRVFDYLKANERYLRDREGGAFDDSEWYRFGRGQALDVVALPKIITPDLAPRSSFLLDSVGGLFLLGGAAGGYGLLLKHDLRPEYVLGLLNSRLLSLFITASGQQMESGYYSFEARFIRSAPIRRIDSAKRADNVRHDRIVKLVEEMQSLQKRLLTAMAPHDKLVVEGQIAAADRQIDHLVYELYDLTPEEIRMVEEGTA